MQNYLVVNGSKKGVDRSTWVKEIMDMAARSGQAYTY